MDIGYRQCKTCVMDTTDPEIYFYDDGTCSHCRHALKYASQMTHRHKLSDVTLFFERACRESFASCKFDVLIGLSGGVDSTWLLHLLSESNLRLYVHHVDTGWNSPEAVTNIYGICDRLNLSLATHVVNWQTMRRLQQAFFYSGVINQDIPQDIAIFTSQVEACLTNRIRFIASGANNTTESILPSSWGHHWHDQANLYAIHKWFWNSSPLHFPYCTISDIVNYRLNKHRDFQAVNILDLITYDKRKAVDLLVKEYDYKCYPHKHGESLWTLYYQSVYLPSVFGIDKRKAHLSNLVINQDMTRDEALRKLEQPVLEKGQLIELCSLVAVKLGIPLEHALMPGQYVLRTEHDQYCRSKSMIDKFTYEYCISNPEKKDELFSEFIMSYESLVMSAAVGFRESAKTEEGYGI